MNRVFRQITLAEAVQLIQEENIENLYFRDKEDLEGASTELVRLVDEELYAENIIYVDWFLEEKTDLSSQFGEFDFASIVTTAQPPIWNMPNIKKSPTVTY